MGSENGATLGGLLGFIPGAAEEGLDSFVQPDDNDEISLLLLNQLEGWAAGATGNEAGEVTANFYVGDYVDGASFIDPASLDDSGAPFISFPGTTITDGLLRTPESSFSLTLPILEGLDLALSLEKASLVGDVTVDDTGFGLSAGVLGGYLTEDSLVTLLDGIYSACGIGRDPVGTPPDFCDTARVLITGDTAGDIIALTAIVPFDTIAEDSGMSACTTERAADCNAISLCLLVGMESTAIRGISEE
jgi:hypothetical protein